MFIYFQHRYGSKKDDTSFKSIIHGTVMENLFLAALKRFDFWPKYGIVDSFSVRKFNEKLFNIKEKSI